jgi:hypothetical protein
MVLKEGLTMRVIAMMLIALGLFGCEMPKRPSASMLRCVEKRWASAPTGVSHKDVWRACEALHK